ncbi:MAG: pyridoxal-phosphate dependent enzyme, partial [Bacteroidia bacterium]|nr:pyridoxal-phosphate dependent enzyme [Bacteroidia bacterium]
EINNSLLSEKEISLYVLQLDKIHPEINGNKYFKLKYNLEEAKKNNSNCILTFGGAYSNHLLATAFAGKNSGIKTIGIVRGEELKADSNPLLKKCAELGMQLHFISRTEYRKKEEADFIGNLQKEFGNFLLVPEGGSNKLAVKGASEISDLIKIDFDFICCACGTGGTIAGISKNLKPHQKTIGIAVVNAPEYFQKQISELLSEKKIPENIILNHDFHFGGYAKSSPELESFSKSFTEENKIPLDPIYNAKLFYGLADLIRNNYFKRGSVVVGLNTGGYL